MYLFVSNSIEKKHTNTLRHLVREAEQYLRLIQSSNCRNETYYKNAHNISKRNKKNKKESRYAIVKWVIIVFLELNNSNRRLIRLLPLDFVIETMVEVRAYLFF